MRTMRLPPCNAPSKLTLPGALRCPTSRTQPTRASAVLRGRSGRICQVGLQVQSVFPGCLGTEETPNPSAARTCWHGLVAGAGVHRTEVITPLILVKTRGERATWGVNGEGGRQALRKAESEHPKPDPAVSHCPAASSPACPKSRGCRGRTSVPSLSLPSPAAAEAARRRRRRRRIRGGGDAAAERCKPWCERAAN